MLWYLDENGDISVLPVRQGITDGSMTEVLAQEVEEGMQIIAGVSVVEESGGIQNPFNRQEDNDMGSRFRRGGGF